MKDLVLFGGGGHCRAVIDVIESLNEFRVVAIVDRKENVGNKVLNYEITHGDDDLAPVFKKYNLFLVTVGQIKTPDPRIRIYNSIREAGGELATVISRHAYVSKYAKVGKGSVVMHGSIVNANAVIGENCILNTKSLVEHDAVIEDHSHISTAAIVNGGTVVKTGSFVGSNAVVREYLEVPEKSIVPAGSAFVKRSL